MLCKLCRKHNQRPQRVRQGCAVWVDVQCFRILNYLLTISIEGPKLEEFDFEKTADIWGAQKNRRITFTS